MAIHFSYYVSKPYKSRIIPKSRDAEPNPFESKHLELFVPCIQTLDPYLRSIRKVIVPDTLGVVREGINIHSGFFLDNGILSKVVYAGMLESDQVNSRVYVQVRSEPVPRTMDHNPLLGSSLADRLDHEEFLYVNPRKSGKSQPTELNKFRGLLVSIGLAAHSKSEIVDF